MDGLELRNARVEGQLTQKDLGKMVGLKNWQICELETGRKPVTPELAEKLTDALTTPRPKPRKKNARVGISTAGRRVPDADIAQRIREGFEKFARNCALAAKRGIVVDLTCHGERVQASDIDIASIAKTF